MNSPTEPQKIDPHLETPHVNKDLPKNNSKSKTLIWLTLFLLLVGLAWFAYWFFYLQYHESTDDAFANGNYVAVNSAVNGSVIAFFADDTDLVEEGQLLIQLDPTYYQATYEKELATLASVVLQVRQLYGNVVTNQALVDNKKASLAKAQYDFENRSRLVSSKAISNEDFIHSKDNLLIAQLELKQAEAQLEIAIDLAGNTSMEKHPLIEQQKSTIRTAYYNLKHSSIYASCTGYIAQRAANVGEWVTPVDDLMVIIPTDYVWVDANFKETQLTHMRVGQPAKVWFDLYGSKVIYEGKVLGIASGTGSVFSLIPPQNATGNWIKIVQRLPVRISLDAETLKKYPTRLGISAEVDVDITNRDLPILSIIPSKKVISSTKVFDIHLEEVDKVMDEVINRNMKKEPS